MALYRISVLSDPITYTSYLPPESNELFEFRRSGQAPTKFTEGTPRPSAGGLLCIMQLKLDGSGVQGSWSADGLWHDGGPWAKYGIEPYACYRTHAQFHLNHLIREMFDAPRKAESLIDHGLIKLIADLALPRGADVRAMADTYLAQAKAEARPIPGIKSLTAMFYTHWAAYHQTNPIPFEVTS